MTKLVIKMWLGTAMFRDIDGTLYSVQCCEPATGKRKLPVAERRDVNGLVYDRSSLVWHKNILMFANDHLKAFGTKKNLPFPYGLNSSDASDVPWNNWKPTTAAEKAAEIKEEQ